jgi:uncharacterized membrane protein YeaQ/YmgE (transglycosylase-associated protein family)
MEIGLLGFLLLLLIAAVVGFIAQRIVGWGGGLLASIGVGFVGALLGVLLARATGLPEIFVLNVGGVAFPIVWALVGSILLVLVIALAMGGYRRRRVYID